MNDWYNHPVSSKEFKTGLKGVDLFQLRSLLGVFRKRQLEGQKVAAKINAIRKEKERRKKVD
ncbi:hypothetical protein [Clostridium kluyveri]|uniref:hypothetical protein n=1 Tax=Clostridium kluyveri TaxID=1534 RepID=UPI0022459BC0|nr:hypothetical protein [Clostridium kluyveri]UZQ49084.1 hypothetical protein OP486_14090 [Clostridium kluyveri]